MLAFITRPEVEATGKPFFTGHRWISSFPSSRVLLTRSRCFLLGFPVSQDEEAAAYRFVVKGPDHRKYTPVFDRTAQVTDRSLLYEKEIYEPPLNDGR